MTDSQVDIEANKIASESGQMLASAQSSGEALVSMASSASVLSKDSEKATKNEESTTQELLNVVNGTTSIVDQLEAEAALASAALQKATEEHGQMAFEAAPLYFKYGDALLKIVEERMDIFGGDALAAQGVAGVKEAESLNELASIAWETLEVARSIFSKQPESGLCQKYIEGSPAELFAFTYQRLGDLQTMNEKFDGAISDYTECLEQMKRAKMFRSDIATIYFSLGHTEILRLKYVDALRYLRAAAPIFELLVREATGTVEAQIAHGQTKAPSKSKGKRKAKAIDDRAKEIAKRLPIQPQPSDNKKAKQFRQSLKETYDLIDNCVSELEQPSSVSSTTKNSTGSSTATGPIGGGINGKSRMGVTQVGFGNVQIDESEIQTISVRKKPRSEDISSISSTVKNSTGGES